MDLCDAGPLSQYNVQVDGESYHIKQTVISYAGVPHMGFNETWVCPAFWQHFTEGVKQLAVLFVIFKVRS